MILICGPCQVESFDHTLMMAGRIAEISARLGVEIIFKASFDKANRTSGTSPRGAGLETAMRAFRAVRVEHGLRILTDVHESWHADLVADYVDVIQIPAKLCRQTDLIVAAARTGRAVNIKKGQDFAAAGMRFAVSKARDGGAGEVWATERATFFGYEDLVVDMRSILWMGASSGADGVIYDATHSVQSPGSLDGATGGNRYLIEPLARAAMAAGADGLFVETHQDPDSAPSDGPVMLPVDTLYDFLARMRDLHAFVKGL